jgi:pimeloyl-ACP methyl ester carboxylesterase
MAAVVLPDTIRAFFPFQSNFLTLSDGQRMHYIDEGPRDGTVLVFAHGYPSWSFTFRAMAVYFAARGFRCVAMDHVGFGLSDKPVTRRYHTLRHHIANLTELITTLELQAITLIMEDWGGPLGLGYAMDHRDNVRRLVVMNVWAFQDTYTNRLHPVIRWLTRPGLGEVLFGMTNLPVSLGVQRWTTRQLSSNVMAAYKLPFREPRSRMALIQFPRMINTTPTHPSAEVMRAIETTLHDLRRVPVLVVWGGKNPLLQPDIAAHWKSLLPRACDPVIIPRSSHLLAEDAPDAVIDALDPFLEDHT